MLRGNRKARRQRNVIDKVAFRLFQSCYFLFSSLAFTCLLRILVLRQSQGVRRMHEATQRGKVGASVSSPAAQLSRTDRAFLVPFGWSCAWRHAKRQDMRAHTSRGGGCCCCCWCWCCYGFNSFSCRATTPWFSLVLSAPGWKLFLLPTSVCGKVTVYVYMTVGNFQTTAIDLTTERA